jgi:hypothetical protein
MVVNGLNGLHWTVARINGPHHNRHHYAGLHTGTQRAGAFFGRSRASSGGLGYSASDAKNETLVVDLARAKAARGVRGLL